MTASKKVSYILASFAEDAAHAKKRLADAKANKSAMVAALNKIQKLAGKDASVVAYATSGSSLSIVIPYEVTSIKGDKGLARMLEKLLDVAVPQSSSDYVSDNYIERSYPFSMDVGSLSVRITVEAKVKGDGATCRRVIKNVREVVEYGIACD